MRVSSWNKGRRNFQFYIYRGSVRKSGVTNWMTTLMNNKKMIPNDEISHRWHQRWNLTLSNTTALDHIFLTNKRYKSMNFLCGVMWQRSSLTLRFVESIKRNGKATLHNYCIKSINKVRQITTVFQNFEK